MEQKDIKVGMKLWWNGVCNREPPYRPILQDETEATVTGFTGCYQSVLIQESDGYCWAVMPEDLSPLPDEVDETTLCD